MCADDRSYYSDVELADAWERNADQWLAWADPAHEDGFWSVTWPTLRQLLPPPDGLVIDLGCGEGRGLRELRGSGYDGIGIDRSPTLAHAAAGQSPESRVVIADAARLPIFDACASVVFASMSLLDMDDLDSTLAEVRRVLRPGGALCAAIVHPFISAFRPETVHEGTFHLDGSYLSSRHYLDNVTRDGRSMTFASMHRPLHEYFDRLFNLGFVITAVREEGGGPVPWLLAFRATAHA